MYAYSNRSGGGNDAHSGFRSWKKKTTAHASRIFFRVESVHMFGIIDITDGVDERAMYMVGIMSQHEVSA